MRSGDAAMKTGWKVALGVFGVLLIPTVVQVLAGSGARPSPDTPVAGAQPDTSTPARPGLRTDIFGPPAPPRPPGEPIPVAAPPVLPPDRAKDADGYYEVDVPAGLYSNQAFRRMSREIRQLLIDTREDAEAGWAVRVAVYLTWKSGAKDKIVQMVFAPDTVKQLLNSPAWLKDSAVENIPDLVEAKTVINPEGFWQLCKEFALSDNGVQVAGQRFCMYR
jgi:hypothetical protein